MSGLMTHWAFEIMAREVMAAHFGTEWSPELPVGLPKRFDLISRDGRFVGDAKYYTLVGGKGLPPAKFATIAEHVWLLEKTRAETRFLVFGNQIEVPHLWLKRYAPYCGAVQFFFLLEDKRLERLK